MNAILGMTELVLDSPLSPSQREYLRIAHESARSLLGILDDILDFSVIQSGKIELQSEPFSVRELGGRRRWNCFVLEYGIEEAESPVQSQGRGSGGFVGG